MLHISLLHIHAFSHFASFSPLRHPSPLAPASPRRRLLRPPLRLPPLPQGHVGSASSPEAGRSGYSGDRPAALPIGDGPRRGRPEDRFIAVFPASRAPKRGQSLSRAFTLSPFKRTYYALHAFSHFAPFRPRSLRASRPSSAVTPSIRKELLSNYPCNHNETYFASESLHRSPSTVVGISPLDYRSTLRSSRESSISKEVAHRPAAMPAPASSNRTPGAQHADNLGYIQKTLRFPWTGL